MKVATKTLTMMTTLYNEKTTAKTATAKRAQKIVKIKIK